MLHCTTMYTDCNMFNSPILSCFFYRRWALHSGDHPNTFFVVHIGKDKLARIMSYFGPVKARLCQLMLYRQPQYTFRLFQPKCDNLVIQCYFPRRVPSTRSTTQVGLPPRGSSSRVLAEWNIHKGEWMIHCCSPKTVPAYLNKHNVSLTLWLSSPITVFY